MSDSVCKNSSGVSSSEGIRRRYHAGWDLGDVFRKDKLINQHCRNMDTWEIKS